MRYILEPMQRYLFVEIKLSSEVWLQQQQSVSISQGGSDLTNMLKSREWPLLVASLCREDEACMKRLEDLHCSENFSGLPLSWRSVNNRHLVTKMLSREGAIVYELLLQMHLKPPFVVFLLLVDAERYLSTIEGLCDSMKDAYTKSFTEY